MFLSTEHTQLMNDILAADNMIDPDSPMVEEQAEIQRDLELMCHKLGMLEEVMFLTTSVDCDCFYIPKERI